MEAAAAMHSWAHAVLPRTACSKSAPALLGQQPHSLALLLQIMGALPWSPRAALLGPKGAAGNCSARDRLHSTGKEGAEPSICMYICAFVHGCAYTRVCMCAFVCMDAAGLLAHSSCIGPRYPQRFSCWVFPFCKCCRCQQHVLCFL